MPELSVPKSAFSTAPSAAPSAVSDSQLSHAASPAPSTPSSSPESCAASVSPVSQASGAGSDSGSDTVQGTAADTTCVDTTGYRITPMFEQYLAIKNQYPDALLFYRMGDFYELFFEDAVVASRELQLALTRRDKNKANSVPMCGVPWHAVESYTSQLVDKGYNIVICDQVEDPRQAKGLVKREVTRILTPGTLIEDVNLEAKQHNFLGALVVEKDEAAFVWADISTGQWSGLDGSHKTIWQYILKFAPRELIIQDEYQVPEDVDTASLRLVRRGKTVFDFRQCSERLKKAQHVNDLAALGMQASPLLPRAAGALVAYLEQTHKREPEHLLPFRPTDPGHYLIVDEVTERNLEIFQCLNGSRGRGTLRSVMDATMTPMGGRYLEDMLRNPLRDSAAISAIQDAVACLAAATTVRNSLRQALDHVFDLERLTTRICLNRALPKDFLALRTTLQALPRVRAALEELEHCTDAAGQPVPLPLPPSLQELLDTWDEAGEYCELLERALEEPAPALITEGGIFRHGYNQELDSLLDFSEHGEQLLQKLLEEDQERVGSIRLKLGNNRVFGYYYEISRIHSAEKLPEDFVRRQTLANAERYTTARLKQLEDNIVQSTERRCSLEYRLFQELREQIATIRPRLVHISGQLARLDYWQGLAHMAREHNWVRPKLTAEPVLFIQEGRHPVVEDMIGAANFVPNSFTLDSSRRLCLLTGPNMAGKSTILRQVALICLMAQTGSFVPAASATLGLVDRLFTRVGASDNLAQGQSTFMVEMMETARILRQATRHSLIILDEIGRGTSTYDGLALAWAVAEDLAQRFGGQLRTLFATHYHELTELEGQIPGVFTMNIAIREFNKNIIFLHKLLPGPTDRSYGVEVARLAGVPQTVVNRARDLLDRFETLRRASHRAVHTLVAPGRLPGLPDLPGLTGQQATAEGRQKTAGKGKKLAEPGCEPQQPKEHPLERILQDLDPESLTPLAALNLLGEWKKIWGSKSAAQGQAEADSAGGDAEQVRA